MTTDEPRRRSGLNSLLAPVVSAAALLAVSYASAKADEAPPQPTAVTGDSVQECRKLLAVHDALANGLVASSVDTPLPPPVASDAGKIFAPDQGAGQLGRTNENLKKGNDALKKGYGASAKPAAGQTRPTAGYGI